MQSIIFFWGKGSPIVPVHANSNSFGLILTGCSSSLFCLTLRPSAKFSAITFKLLKPSAPVKAFAFLVLIIIALIFLVLIF